MDTREFNKIDLNLLISLQVLLEEKSVSRAAQRLFITQSAMSKTLTRLRNLFDDELFTRCSHGMQPTPRAIELSSGLNGILGDIAHLLTGPRFDPRSFKGEVALALSEYIGVALLPRLTAQLNAQAPRLDLRVITRIEDPLQALAQGNLDFVFHVKQAEYNAEYRVETVGGGPLAILIRENHPLATEEMTWDRLMQFPLIKLYASNREQVEIQQNAATRMPIGNHPLGTLEISHLLTALEVLRQTDYFMPAPAFLLQQEDATAGIVGLQMPRGSDLNIEYALVAHRRASNSPLHNWLWEEIMRTIRDLRTPLQRKMRQRITATSTGPKLTP